MLVKLEFNDNELEDMQKFGMYMDAPKLFNANSEFSEILRRSVKYGEVLPGTSSLSDNDLELIEKIVDIYYQCLNKNDVDLEKY